VTPRSLAFSVGLVCVGAFLGTHSVLLAQESGGDKAPAAAVVDPLGGRPGLGAIDPARPGFGSAPQVTPEVTKKFGQFVESVGDPDNTLDMVLGVPRLMVLKKQPMRIQIPDERIASYDILSGKEVSITPKAVGATVLNLWFDEPGKPDGGQVLSYLVRVFPDPQYIERLKRIYGSLEKQINEAFPKSKINLVVLGDNVLVKGKAHDAREATHIMQVLQASIPGSTVEAPIDVAEQLPAAINAQAPLTPTVTNFVGPRPPAGAGGSGRRATGQRAGSTHLINLMRIAGTNQVMLRVTVAEVNRSAARSIGLNFALKDSAGRLVFQNNTGNLANFSFSNQIATNANMPMILDGGQISIALNALRELNLAKSLAEPNLVTVDGRNASFQAGGQFPVPVVTGATSTGLQSVQFVPFGVQLNFTPYITDKNLIRLVVSADVSTRDNSNSVFVGNTNIPSINTRNFQTTVDLRAGQTFAVAGLIQQNMAAKGSRIPGLGDLPIMSSLLGASQTSSQEQELIILVNTELVEPLDGAQVPKLPGHNIYPPSDLEFFFGGRLESRHQQDFRPALQTDWDRIVKYQEVQRSLISGPSGHSDGRTGVPSQATTTPAATTATSESQP
jgi:pilus assembly protein CpaC